MARRLRIDVSVFFALVAIALCALWVRSYWLTAVVSVPVTANWWIGAGMAPGALWVVLDHPRVLAWDTASIPSEAWLSQDSAPYYSSRVWGGFVYKDGVIVVPCWFLLAIAAGLGVAPWMPWKSRFSLRTMLIATTLIAIVLGLTFWAFR